MQTLATKPANAVAKPEATAGGGWQLSLVVAVAFAAFLIHQNALGIPNSALTFDGFGFLVVTNNWLSILTPELLAKVSAYVAHGFSAVDQAALVQYLGPAGDVVRCGPLMPMLLGLPYLILHKPAMAANWQIASTTMCFVQALTVGIIWACARRCGDRVTAYVAAGTAILYSGIVLNSGRLMLEVPASCALMWMVWMALRVFTDEGDQGHAGSVRSRSLLADTPALSTPLGHAGRVRSQSLRWNEILCGVAMALPALARPTLLLVPAVMLIALFVCSMRNGASEVRWRSMLVNLTLGAAICFVPWAAMKCVLTGHPSITIDRYGAYNLISGLDVGTDGFDLASSDYVATPSEFKITAKEAVRKIMVSVVGQPERFADMMLRKAGRLIDSPWNDFQVPCWFAAYAWQAWLHRILCLLAAAGLLQMTARAVRSRKFADAVAPALFGSIIACHFVALLFISMPRYMAPAMPVMIVLSSYCCTAALKNFGRKKFALLLIASAALPTACLTIDYLSTDTNQFLQSIAAHFGLKLVSADVPLFLSAIALAWCTVVARTMITRSERVLNAAWLAVAISLTACCFASARNSMQALEYNFQLTKQTPSLTVEFANSKAASNTDQAYFLIVDCHNSRIQPRPLRYLSASINGNQVNAEFQPLFAIDKGSRDSLMYERTIASSAGVEAESLRQWWCLPITVPARAASGNNIITLTNSAPTVSPLFISADFFSAGRVNHKLSLKDFSWIKGFMCNHPGEMRLDLWNHSMGEGQQELRPRVYLVRQDEVPSPGMSFAKTFPDARISPLAAQRMTRYKVDGNELGEVPSASIIKLTVTGEYRCLGKNGEASAVLVEHFLKDGSQSEQLSPLAPSVLHTTGQWQNFQFDDFVAMSNKDSKVAPDVKINSIELLMFGRPWYQALQYGNVRPTSTTEFKNLKLKAQTFEHM